MTLALLDRLTDLALYKTVRTIHHAFREVALPVEGLSAGKTLRQRQFGKTEDAQDKERSTTREMVAHQDFHASRNRSTACSFQTSPEPGRLGTRALPLRTSRGCSRTGLAQSTYSSQWQVGVTASRWALTSGKRWLDISQPAAWARAAARIQPETPPMRCRSGMTKSDARSWSDSNI